MVEKWQQFQDLLHRVLKHTLILRFPKPVQLRKNISNAKLCSYFSCCMHGLQADQVWLRLHSNCWLCATFSKQHFFQETELASIFQKFPSQLRDFCSTLHACCVNMETPITTSLQIRTDLGVILKIKCLKGNSTPKQCANFPELKNISSIFDRILVA